MFLIRKKRKIAAEEFYIAQSRLLSVNITKNDTLTWVLLIHFATENKLSLFSNNSINCSIRVLELTLLKLTQCYSNICLTTYFFLTNLFLVHSGQNFLFLTARQERQVCSKHITFHLLSRLTKSFDLNKNKSLFKSKI